MLPRQQEILLHLNIIVKDGLNGSNEKMQLLW